MTYSLDKITSAYKKIDNQSFVNDNEESSAFFNYNEEALAVADAEKLASNDPTTFKENN